MNILSPETDNCPSWISGRERMTVENISWSISTKECCRPRRGLNPRPPGLQSDVVSCFNALCDGRIRGNPYRRLILHETGVVSHVGVLYIPEDPRTQLSTFDTAWYWRCVSCRCVVHLVGPENTITDIWYCVILALCLRSVCCTSDRIRGPPYRRFILPHTGVVSHVGVLCIR